MVSDSRMLMPIHAKGVSPEFLELCRSQLALLGQNFGASLSVVYLTQELLDGTQTPLVAIAAYPELPEVVPLAPMPASSQAPVMQEQFSADAVNVSNSVERQNRRLELPAAKSAAKSTVQPWADHEANTAEEGVLQQAFQPNPGVTPAVLQQAFADPRQIVLPLIQEETMLGLLVTRRDDRRWQAAEQHQVERVAQTLTIACVLDQRSQWLERQRQQEHRVQQQQHLLMDNLLHQFRNSLTALQTFGKLMLKRLLPGESNHDLASNLVRETERLKDLSHQLERVLAVTQTPPAALPAAQPEWPALAAASQTVPVEAVKLERCLVETVLAPLLAAAAPIAEANQLQLHHQIADALPPIWANPQTLHEVLNNLIENALKYTPAGGHILVAALEEAIEPAQPEPDDAQLEARSPEEWVTIAIHDTGLGIPLPDQQHLFERHFRGVQAEGEIPGSGLGLAIARGLIEQMEGSIQAVSPGLWSPPEGKALPGSTFLVRLKAAI
jgi:signal transduction histidine kinase